MKTLLKDILAIIKVSLPAIILLAFTSCYKYDYECQEWEVEDKTFFTGQCQGGFCYGGSAGTIRQLSICGESLNDARSGNSIILRENQCCRTTRHFIRKL